MSRMDDNALLSLLRTKEDDASAYVWGQLGAERESAMREYHRMPYGNEEDGWSQIVTSDVQDTVEWILPALLKIFTSTDQAVSFDPSNANDVEGAEQATDACNYVFYKQNNGFLTLYTAFKDALTVRNCAVMWRKEDQKHVSTVPFQGATAEMLALLTQDGGEIVAANPSFMDDGMGNVVEVFDGRIRKTETKTVVRVEAFPPEDLLIDREWTSPLLSECPYVARMLRVTLSDLKEMGYDVAPEELAGSDGAEYSADASFRLSKIGQTDAAFEAQVQGKPGEEDDSLTEGWLRVEYVLVDYDGDGVAERRCIYRLRDKILKNEETSHVPIATASPMLNTHRWDGMSMTDAVSDLQKLHTELLRQTMNSAYLANTPRKKVLTDANWTPLANIDDLLDARPGAIIRQRQGDAVQEDITPFVAGATLPLLEYVASMRENRTGVTRYNQGIDANSLNKTASGINSIMTASQQRLELIARIMAETLVKPIFQGILKLLTDDGMQKLAFRLRDKFVEYDPNEWRDWYDMTVNVGLGTGNKDQQLMHLQRIAENQMLALQGGFDGVLVDPIHLYNVQAKLAENAGFKNVQDFWRDPSTNPPEPKPPQVPPEVQKEEMRIKADQQKFQAQAQADQQKAAFDAQQKAVESDRNAALQMQLENMRLTSQERQRVFELAANALVQIGMKEKEREEQEEPEAEDRPELDIASLAEKIELMAQAMMAPKQIIRDAQGRVAGVAPM